MAGGPEGWGAVTGLAELRAFLGDAAAELAELERLAEVAETAAEETAALGSADGSEDRLGMLQVTACPPVAVTEDGVPLRELIR